MMQTFTSAFLDEMEKVGRRRKRRRLTIRRRRIKVPKASKKEKKDPPSWMRRLGLVIRRFLTKRSLVGQGMKTPKLVLPK